MITMHASAKLEQLSKSPVLPSAVSPCLFFFYIVRKVNCSFLVTRGASERKNYVVGLSATHNYLLSSEVVAVNII